jgi:transcriptional regulator with XRE-family HTH domain
MIRLSRKRANLTLGRVAKECRLSASRLERIESGEVHPSAATLARIARALRVTVVDLVLDAEEVAGLFAAGTANLSSESQTALSVIARAVLELADEVGSKLDAVESATILLAMTACSDNQSAAARLLGMERKAFTRRLSWLKGARPDPDASARRAE